MKKVKKNCGPFVMCVDRLPTVVDIMPHFDY